MSNANRNFIASTLMRRCVTSLTHRPALRRFAAMWKIDVYGCHRTMYRTASRMQRHLGQDSSVNCKCILSTSAEHGHEPVNREHGSSQL